MGLIFLASPGFFGFTAITSARNAFLNLGFGLIGYSLLTQYKLSIFKLIPLRVHMFLDGLCGISIALSPWVLGYRDSITGVQFAAHWVLGIAMVSLVYATRTKSERAVAPEDRGEFREAA